MTLKEKRAEIGAKILSIEKALEALKSDIMKKEAEIAALKEVQILFERSTRKSAKELERQ